MQNVTDTVCQSKPGMYRVGLGTCHFREANLLQRILYVSNLLEGRPRHRVFYHQVSGRGSDEEVGINC